MGGYNATETGKRQVRQEEQTDIIKRESVFLNKEITECDRQYNGNKITNLFFLCGWVTNDPWLGGWGTLLYSTSPSWH